MKNYIKKIRIYWTLALFIFFNNSFAQNEISSAVSQKQFAVRGFHIDLRIQVMKMSALKNFALNLSKNGINTLIMEWEASYPYERHAVVSSRYAYSRDQIKEFVSYCTSLGMDVIPLQQSFGHVEYILRHQRYKNIREDQKDYSQVNPLKEEENRALFSEMYKDLIGLHTSKYIHIGGDETYLLGHSAESQKKVAAVGKGKLYGDYLKILCDIVISLGKRPIVWADIALHYPDALKQLPKETIFIDWNYGWDLNKFGDHQKLMESGFEIWGSPAIRSDPDNYFYTGWEKHFNNISNFIPEARKLTFKGIVMTSWSTSGVYSTVFESPTEVIDLPPLRRVYPISGFNMLIQAYHESLKVTNKLNIKQFIQDYSYKQYGLNMRESESFWLALKSTPYGVIQGDISKTGINLKDLVDSTKLAASILRQLSVKQNKKEFEHYLLMADIRIFYLECMLIQKQMNNIDYSVSTSAILLKKLKELKPIRLNRRFIRLNKYMLYPSELIAENELRNQRWLYLKNKLEGTK